MDLTIPGIISIIALSGTVAASHFSNNTDIAVNAANIQNITKQLWIKRDHLRILRRKLENSGQRLLRTAVLSIW